MKTFTAKFAGGIFRTDKNKKLTLPPKESAEMGLEFEEGISIPLSTTRKKEEVER